MEPSATHPPYSACSSAQKQLVWYLYALVDFNWKVSLTFRNSGASIHISRFSGSRLLETGARILYSKHRSKLLNYQNLINKKNSENNTPYVLVEDVEISGRKVKTWAEIVGVGVTETTVTTIERMYTSGASDRLWGNLCYSTKETK